MRAVHRSSPIALIALAVLAGCSETLDPPSPAQVAIFGGDAQVAEVGATLPAPLAIRITDGKGFPQREVPVTWEVVEGDGSVSAVTSSTSLTGIAEAQWRLGTGAGVQRVRATVQGVGSADFSARAVPGAPTLVDFVQDSLVTRSIGDTIRVLADIKDRFGNPIPSVALAWSSDNSNIATVDPSGLVRIVGRGRTMIRARIGPATEFVPVHVIEIARVRLTPADTLFVSLNQTIQFQAVAEDANRQSLPPGTVNWTSADSRIVTVDQAGRVRAAGQGNTTVTVSIDGKTASVPVSVQQVPVGVSISPENSVIGLGRTLQLSATVLDAGGSPIPGFVVDYGISDGSIASVTPSGLVTAHGRGRVDITASTGRHTARTQLQIATLLTAVSAGGTHVCGIGAVTTTTIGIGVCWGAEGDGQLGSTGPTPVNTPRAVNSTLTFSDITAGANHSCALSGGTARCWGAGAEGQLGNGAATSSAPLVTVTSGGYTEISAGGAHTCAVVGDGVIHCWGSNQFGQLGRSGAPDTCGSLPCAKSPVAVTGSFSWSRVSAGMHHTCAITTTGELYCWGLNNFGQLGDGTTTNSPSPQRVVASELFTAVSAGATHTCAVAGSGRVYCWGRNNAGQLGNGSTTDSPVAISVNSGIPFVQVSVGEEHSCARSATGSVYCWGENGVGQLGTGNNADALSPTVVAGNHSFLSIDAGRDFTCGVLGTSGNSIGYCWGANTSGQVGNGTLQNQNTPSRVF